MNCYWLCNRRNVKKLAIWNLTFKLYRKKKESETVDIMLYACDRWKIDTCLHNIYEIIKNTIPFKEHYFFIFLRKYIRTSVTSVTIYHKLLCFSDLTTFTHLSPSVTICHHQLSHVILCQQLCFKCDIKTVEVATEHYWGSHWTLLR